MNTNPLSSAAAEKFTRVRAFLDDSIRTEQEEKEAKRRARRRQLQLLALVIIVVTALAFFSSVQWRNAERQKRHAEEARVIAEREKAQAVALKQKALRTQSLFLTDLSRQQLEKGDAVTAILLALEALPKDLDRPERPYVREGEQALYHAALQKRERVVLKHEDWVFHAAFSPDGTHLLTASYDKTARLWDAETGTLLHTLAGHKSWVEHAIFSPDGTRVLTASPDSTARLWDVETGTLLHTLAGHKSWVEHAVFSPNGTRVFTASSDNTARLWDANSGTSLYILSGHEDLVAHAAFSPDGTHLLTASWDNTARLWDADSGIPLHILSGHEDSVAHAAFSPDGHRVLTASYDKTARLWDTDSGTLLYIFSGHEGWVDHASFSPDGHRVLTASYDKTARIWDAETGTLLHTLAKHKDLVSHAAFSPDGLHILTTSYDNTARLWDVDSGVLLHTLPHESSVNHVAFSPDNRRILTASRDNTARLWDISQHELGIKTLFGHTDSVTHVAFSPDGKKLATASYDGSTRLWDTQSGNLLETAYLAGWGLTHLAFSPDGKQLITSNRDASSFLLLDTETGMPLHNFEGDGIRHFSFSPDGRLLATASDIVHVWNTQTGQQLYALENHKDVINYAEFNSDGSRLVTASRDGTARIWDARNEQILHVLQNDNNTLRAQFSPDDRVIATISGNIARLWDVESGQRLYSLVEHEGTIMHMDFSPDGNCLATASEDDTVVLWNVKNGNLHKKLMEHDWHVWHVSFSPDGMLLATASADKTARLWNIQTGELLHVLEVDGLVFQAQFSPDGRYLATSYGGRYRNVLGSRFNFSYKPGVRIWEIFNSSAELMVNARQALPRELSPAQKQTFFLELTPMDHFALAREQVENHLQGDPPKHQSALQSWRQALAQQIQDPQHLFTVHKGIAEALAALKKDAEAILAWKRALALVPPECQAAAWQAAPCDKINFITPQDLAAMQSQLGDVHLRLQDRTKAVTAYRASAALLNEPEYTTQAAEALVKLGDALRESGDMQAALKNYDSIPALLSGNMGSGNPAPHDRGNGHDTDSRAEARMPENNTGLAALANAHAGRMAAYGVLDDRRAVSAGAEAVRLARLLAERKNDAELWRQALDVYRDWRTAYQKHCPATSGDSSCPAAALVYRQGAEITLRSADKQEGETAPQAYLAAFEAAKSWREAAPDAPEAQTAVPESLRKQGEAYLALKDKEKAAAAWRTALENAPTERDVISLVLIHARLAQYGAEPEQAAHAQTALDYAAQLAAVPDNVEALQAVAELIAKRPSRFSKPGRSELALRRKLAEAEPYRLSRRADLAAAYEASDDTRGKAVAIHAELARLDPNTPVHYENQGRIHLLLGNLSAADKVYRKQLEIMKVTLADNQEYPGFWAKVGAMLKETGQAETALLAWQKQVEEMRKQNRLEQVAAAYQAQTDIKSNHPSAWFNLGELYKKQEKWENALAAYRRQTEAKPGHHDAWNGQCYVLRQLKKLEESLAACRKQVEIRPAHHWAWYNIGMALQKQDKLDEALEAFRKQAEVAPEHEMAWYRAGKVYTLQRKWDAAIKAFETQLDIKPEHERAKLALGDAITSEEHAKRSLGFESSDDINRKLAQPIDNAYRYVEENPKNLNAWIDLGYKLLAANRLDEAVNAFRKSIEIQDTNIGWRSLGLVLKQQDKLDEAIAALKKSIEIEPHPSGYNNLVDALRMKGELDEAVSVARKGLETYPKHKGFWITLGWTLSAQGKTQEAIDTYRHLLKLEPEDLNAWLGLYSERAKQNDLDGAAKALSSARELNPDGRRVVLLSIELTQRLANDAKIALVQNDLPWFQSRLDTALPLLTPRQQESAILPLLVWLAEPEKGWEPVLQAIEKLNPAVEFTWDFGDMQPAIERQNAAVQQAARLFIEFFQNKINLATLKTHLSKASSLMTVH
ncbi:MAG: tetratricopeptide repeat protein [Gammaproteobacteria bacterium]|nr:tetratricopeptide repeat protein [Gammaproteobacteria bacterium]